MQDLIVEEIQKEMIFLGEAVLQVGQISECPEHSLVQRSDLDLGAPTDSGVVVIAALGTRRLRRSGCPTRQSAGAKDRLVVTALVTIRTEICITDRCSRYHRYSISSFLYSTLL